MDSVEKTITTSSEAGQEPQTLTVSLPSFEPFAPELPKITQAECDESVKEIGFKRITARRVEALASIGRYSNQSGELNVASGAINLCVDNAMDAIAYLQSMLETASTHERIKIMGTVATFTKLIGDNSDRLIKAHAVKREEIVADKKSTNKSFAPGQIVGPVQVNIGQAVADK